MSTDYINSNEIEITVKCLEEYSSAYRAFEECMTEDEITNLLDGAKTNPWRWCVVQVRASYTTPSGKTHFSDSYLGHCSYESEKDFIKNSGYYDQMVNEAIEDLMKNLRGGY